MTHDQQEFLNNTFLGEEDVERDPVGGKFSLPKQIAKLVRLAEGTDCSEEKQSARQKLWDKGYYLDVAGVVWERDDIPDWVKKVDPTLKDVKRNPYENTK